MDTTIAETVKSPPTCITYSISFCDGLTEENNDKTPLIDLSEEEDSPELLSNDCQSRAGNSSTVQVRDVQKNGIPVSGQSGDSEHCRCARSYPLTVPHVEGFRDQSGYGSLPDNMGVVQDSTQFASNASHRVIYCVHGKPSGCCATVVSDQSKTGNSIINVPSETINIDDEDQHCHVNNRPDNIDKKARRKLIIASILCLLFMLAEAVGGVLSSSLAIATDAAHLLTDFASFMISLFALWVARRKPTQAMSFGWYRAEVIGALTSVLTIWVVTGILVYLAAERIRHGDFEIDAPIMLITSSFGVFVNILMGITLHQHGHSHGGPTPSGEEHAENINVRAAYIHVIGDFIQSFGVLVAAIVIYFWPEWKIVDPICTFLFSILVLITTLNILKDTLNVLMEGLPKGIDFNSVLNTFLSIDGVMRVHNLRIWALSLDKTALAAHLAIKPGINPHDILKIASRKIHSKFNFFEMTLQIEDFQENMENCKQCQCPEK